MPCYVDLSHVLPALRRTRRDLPGSRRAPASRGAIFRGPRSCERVDRRSRAIGARGWRDRTTAVRTRASRHRPRIHVGTCPEFGQHEGDTTVLNAPPLADLDRLPFPDYSQFPWSKYPNIIVPMITGRGCGWGVCTFCSDVTSTAGRRFRSRSPKRPGRAIASTPPASAPSYSSLRT